MTVSVTATVRTRSQRTCYSKPCSLIPRVHVAEVMSRPLHTVHVNGLIVRVYQAIELVSHITGSQFWPECDLQPESTWTN